MRKKTHKGVTTRSATGSLPPPRARSPQSLHLASPSKRMRVLSLSSNASPEVGFPYSKFGSSTKIHCEVNCLKGFAKRINDEKIADAQPNDACDLWKIYREIDRKNSSLNEDTYLEVSPRRNQHRRLIDASELINNLVETVYLFECANNLRKRIRSIEIEGRPCPSSVDCNELGYELKFRLAQQSSSIEHTVDRKNRFHFREQKSIQMVPYYDIDHDQDCILLCHIRNSNQSNLDM